MAANDRTRKTMVGLAMAGVALVMAIYFTVYVWGRVGRPQVRDVGVVVPHTTEDWAYYYAAAEAMRTGADIYTVKAPGRDRAGYIYPPLLAFLYQPLARLGLLWGARLSLLVDMAALAGALGFAAHSLLRRLEKPTDWETVVTVAVVAALISLDKIKGEFQMLQCNGLVALGIAMGLWALERRPWLAGAALGFAINIKYQAVAIMLLLILRRRWKAVGWVAAATVFWALLPSVSVGISKDIEYVGRGLGGLLRLVGFKTGPVVANIEPLSGLYSVSITSAAARLIEKTGLRVSPFVLAGAAAVVWLGVLAAMYRRKRLPVLRWPAAAGQAKRPWVLLIGIEWMVVVASVLAFSPETNARHLVQSSLIDVLGVTLVFAAPGRLKWAAAAGLVVIWLGLSLPPGHRWGDRSAMSAWHGVGGPTWCILAGAGLMWWVGTRIASAERDVEVPHAPALERYQSGVP